MNSVSPTAHCGMDVESNRPTGKLIVDLKQAAEMLDISPRKLWQLQADGVVRSLKVGRLLKFRITDLEQSVETWACQDKRDQ